MTATPAVVTETALEAAGAVATSTSLTFTDPDLPWENYERLGTFIGSMEQACRWWVGDLVLYGEQIYGEQFAQIESCLRLSPHTIANRASIARHIPPSRRRASLSFSHHAEVAYLEPWERDMWLDRAEAEGWSRMRLREEMRAAREEQSDGPVGDLAETGSAISGGFLGEPVPDRPIHCPQCGYTWYLRTLQKEEEE